MKNSGALRTISLGEDAGPGRPERRLCAVAGCLRPTSDRKLYCIEHLDGQPYVRRLRVELGRRAEEERAAQERRVRDIDPAGSIARDIVEQLVMAGAQTLGCIGRAVQLPSCSVESCVRVLERAGLVRSRPVTSRNGRRTLVVSLR